MQYLNKPVAAICLAVASAFVQAQEATYDFNIPAQSASQVLNALSKQTGLQPFFTEDSVKGVQSPGVKGKFSLREALGKALAGTGLSYQFTAEKAVAIKAVPAEKVAQLATIEVRGETEKGYAVRRAATATKTDTPLMETPASVQVVPNEVMADQRATLLEDALRNVSFPPRVWQPTSSLFVALKLTEKVSLSDTAMGYAPSYEGVYRSPT